MMDLGYAAFSFPSFGALPTCTCCRSDSVELVSSVTQLIDNIKRFNENAAKFAELMPYHRSWYKLRTELGWLLGPSKYIGYQLSPEAYLESPYSAEKRGRVV